MTEFRECIGIFIVINRYLITLIQDDISGLGCDLLIIGRKLPGKISHLFEISIIVHFDRQRFFFYLLKKGFSRTVILVFNTEIYSVDIDHRVCYRVHIEIFPHIRFLFNNLSGPVYDAAKFVNIRISPIKKLLGSFVVEPLNHHSLLRL